MIDNYLKEELLQKVTSLPRLVIVLREDDCCVKYCELRDTSVGSRLPLERGKNEKPNAERAH